MKNTTVIFDMDGLLIDSEPLWQEAGTEILGCYNCRLTEQQYHSTTGLRTTEWVAHWFQEFGIDSRHIPEASQNIITSVEQKIRERGKAMAGVEHIMQFFRSNNFKIGLASSSPMKLIDVVTNQLNIRQFLDAVTSAEHLPYGKPHPQVFMDCAKILSVPATACICFEDSFNGMIAAKAARMKCVVIPAPQQHDETRWDAADYKLSSLLAFNQELLQRLS